MGSAQFKAEVVSEIRTRKKFFHTLSPYLADNPSIEDTAAISLEETMTGSVETYLTSYVKVCQKEGNALRDTIGHRTYHEPAQKFLQTRQRYLMQRKKDLNELRQSFLADAYVTAQSILSARTSHTDDYGTVTDGLFVYVWRNPKAATAFIRGLECAFASYAPCALPLVCLVKFQGCGVTVSTMMPLHERGRSALSRSPVANYVAFCLSGYLNMNTSTEPKVGLRDVPEASLGYALDCRLYLLNASASLPRTTYNGRSVVVRLELLQKCSLNPNARQSEARAQLAEAMEAATSDLVLLLNNDASDYDLAREMHSRGLNIRIGNCVWSTGQQKGQKSFVYGNGCPRNETTHTLRVAAYLSGEHHFGRKPLPPSSCWSRRALRGACAPVGVRLFCCRSCRSDSNGASRRKYWYATSYPLFGAAVLVGTGQHFQREPETRHVFHGNNWIEAISDTITNRNSTSNAGSHKHTIQHCFAPNV
eukprot:PhM_4_TR2314/c0_g3_i1/m.45932